jgi:hypothetical protein
MSVPNPFRPELREQAPRVSFEEIRARMVEVKPGFSSYFQDGKLVIPISDMKDAKLLVGVGRNLGGNREVELRIKF